MNLTKIGLSMTSREIAEITEKRHDNIMRDIRGEVEKLDNANISTGLIFELSEYEDVKGDFIGRKIFNTPIKSNQ